MSNYTQSIQNLMNQLASLPGIGMRSAERIAFHLLKQKPEEAMKMFDKAGDKDALAILFRAIAFFSAGKYSDAQSNFEKYRKLVPTDPWIRNWLHVVNVKRGEKDDEKLYNSMRNLMEGDPARQIADMFHGTGSLEKAETVDTDIVSQADKNAWFCTRTFYGAEYRLEKGDIAGARKGFRAIPPSRCTRGEGAVAASELARLPPG